MLPPKNAKINVAAQHCKDRHNTENLNQILHSPNFHIHVSVIYIYIPTIGVPILLQKI